MPSNAVIDKVQSLLKRYKKLDLSKVDESEWIESFPYAYALKMSDVAAIREGKTLSVSVIEPQDYDVVTVIDQASETIEDRLFYKNERNKGSVACTGTGADWWIKVTSKFATWLGKLVKDLERKEKTKKMMSKQKTKKKMSKQRPQLGDRRVTDNNVQQIFSIVTTHRWLNVK
jgi:hypothetical protein